MRTVKLALGIALLLSAQTALAGRGGSAAAIQSAIDSNSVDTILAEIERAEFLACLNCINTVLPLVDHPSSRVRDAAGWWLGRRGVRDQVLANMTARLSAQDPVAALHAADVLGGMRDMSSLPSLSAYLAHPLDEDSGVAAARAISAIGAPSAIAALRVGMGSTIAGVRAASLQAVRKLRPGAGMTFVTGAATVVPLLADGDAGVRLQAALTAGYLHDNVATASLAPLVTGDSSPLVRKAAAWAIGEIGDPTGSAALTQAQNDADPLVRSVATAALGRLAH
jgi:HEAT repeat protein